MKKSDFEKMLVPLKFLLKPGSFLMQRLNYYLPENSTRFEKDNANKENA
jgi:hypothetical protein